MEESPLETLTWSDDLLIHNQTLDMDHRKIIGFINQLNQAPDLDLHSEALSDMITTLTHMTAEHFALEEKILAELDYPDLQQHKKDHREFVATVAEVSLSILDNDKQAPGKLLKAMCHLYKDHILDEIKELRPFFTSGKE